MSRSRFISCFSVLLLIGGGVGYWKHASSHSELETPAPAEQTESDEQKARRKLIGVWQDQYQGTRTMTLKEDGTGTMLVELTGIKATVFAPKLRFDMNWSYESNTLKMLTLGGDPEFKVKQILNMMGNTGQDTILELTEERLLLLDKDGKTRYDWKRLKAD